MSDERKARSRVLQKVVKLVLDRHFNLAGVDHQAWARRIKDREPEMLKGDREEFQATVRKALEELGTSHTAFYSERPTRFPPQHTINATLSEIDLNGASRWMFVDVFDDGPAHKAGVEPGDVLFAVDGVEPEASNLPTFGIARTHNLVVARENQTEDIKVDVPFRKGSKHRPPLVEPTSISQRMITPGIGLLKVLYFPGSIGIRFGKMLANSMDILNEQGARSLIIDLRGNIGGSLGFASLVSYLCPGQTPIGYSLTPSRLRKGYSVDSLPRVPMPQNRIETLMALSRFSVQDKSLMLLTQGLGAKSFHGRVTLLVNEWTTSAGEMAAAFAEEAGLATVIGRKTKGTVLGAMNFDVGQEYWLRLPIFGWFTAEGRCLEGTGVTPNISVEARSPEYICTDQDLRRAVDHLAEGSNLLPDRRR